MAVVWFILRLWGEDAYGDYCEERFIFLYSIFPIWRTRHLILQACKERRFHLPEIATIFCWAIIMASTSFSLLLFDCSCFCCHLCASSSRQIQQLPFEEGGHLHGNHHGCTAGTKKNNTGITAERLSMYCIVATANFSPCTGTVPDGTVLYCSDSDFHDCSNRPMGLAKTDWFLDTPGGSLMRFF